MTKYLGTYKADLNFKSSSLSSAATQTPNSCFFLGLPLLSGPIHSILQQVESFDGCDRTREIFRL